MERREFVGLYQRSALSSFLFVVVLDVLTAEIRDRDRWELLLADDLVIIADTQEEMQTRVLQWQESLQKGGLKVNAKKSEVMVSSKVRSDVQVRDVRGEEIKQVVKFKYLGSTLVESGGCEVEVEERIKAAWRKWREVSGVVCDKRMSKRLKAKI